MIAISTDSGTLLKVLKAAEPGSYGFHPRFGFSNEKTVRQRQKDRISHGIVAGVAAWKCRFDLDGQPGQWKLKPVFGCEAVELAPQQWQLQTEFGKFVVAPHAGIPWVPTRPAEPSSKTGPITAFVAALLMVLALWFGQRTETVAEKALPEPVLVKIEPPKKAVKVPMPDVPRISIPQTAQKAAVQRAVREDLGFLGLLGRKNIKNAVGGVPTTIRDASPGAGPGGKEGSGGELLVGLGKGLQKTTVGNTGVAGLGGIGTKGAGGGAGGYGNASVGGGGASRVSSLALSNDLVLEGGLDQSVVQATIAKYLSQVRACYEEGLRTQPGLSGLVKTQFEVMASGTVGMARVFQSTLGDAGVENCIAARIKTWQFPKPLGGTTVKVSYPFLLRPVRSS
jgi:hypothetical protein